MTNFNNRAWIDPLEKKIVRKAGGNQRKRRGADGQKKKRPIEVKVLKKGRFRRFRVGKKAHRNMVAKNGSYHFQEGNKKKRMSAKAVSKKLRGNWTYNKAPHKFIYSSDVF